MNSFLRDVTNQHQAKVEQLENEVARIDDEIQNLMEKKKKCQFDQLKYERLDEIERSVLARVIEDCGKRFDSERVPCKVALTLPSEHFAGYHLLTEATMSEFEKGLKACLMKLEFPTAYVKADRQNIFVKLTFSKLPKLCEYVGAVPAQSGDKRGTPEFGDTVGKVNSFARSKTPPRTMVNGLPGSRSSTRVNDDGGSITPRSSATINNRRTTQRPPTSTRVRPQQQDDVLIHQSGQGTPRSRVRPQQQDDVLIQSSGQGTPRSLRDGCRSPSPSHVSPKKVPTSERRCKESKKECLLRNGGAPAGAPSSSSVNAHAGGNIQARGDAFRMGGAAGASGGGSRTPKRSGGGGGGCRTPPPAQERRPRTPPRRLMEDTKPAASCTIDSITAALIPQLRSCSIDSAKADLPQRTELIHSESEELIGAVVDTDCEDPTPDAEELDNIALDLARTIRDGGSPRACYPPPSPPPRSVMSSLDLSTPEQQQHGDVSESSQNQSGCSPESTLLSTLSLDSPESQ